MHHLCGLTRPIAAAGVARRVVDVAHVDAVLADSRSALQRPLPVLVNHELAIVDSRAVGPAAPAEHSARGSHIFLKSAVNRREKFKITDGDNGRR